MSDLLGHFYQSPHMQLYRYRVGSPTSINLCHWKSGRFHIGHKRWQRPGCSDGQFLLTLHPLQRGCFQSKTYSGFDKAGIRWTIRVRVCPKHNTLVCPYLEYILQACLPNHVADVDCLEQIQWLATGHIKGFRRLPNVILQGNLLSEQ